MSRIINENGDCYTPTDKGRGVDISSQRVDDLDAACLSFIKTFNHSYLNEAVDLGGGFGSHTIKMAQAGSKVTFIDVECKEAQKRFSNAVDQKLISENHIQILEKDFREITAIDIPQSISVLYSQRALHYIRYNECKSLMRLFYNAMNKGGRAFISVAGFDTEYGLKFPDRDKPVNERFSMVTQDMQEKHGIKHPIVTYTEGELRALLEDVGFNVISTTTSNFGNIKAIATKTEKFL